MADMCIRLAHENAGARDGSDPRRGGFLVGRREPA
jgi:hypothetical protein